MSHIVVNDEQAKLILESPGSIEIRDRNGRRLGYVSSESNREFTEEDIAMAKQRMNSDGPWYTTREVLAHLESLEHDSMEPEPTSLEEEFELTEEDIAIAKMAMKSDGPRYTTREVIEYLKSLEPE